MKFWIVGTDTDVGKTTVSAWICFHTKCHYWKPVQTGCQITIDNGSKNSIDTKVRESSVFQALKDYIASDVAADANFHIEGSDSYTVSTLSGTMIHPESYVFRAPLSPHIAGPMDGKEVLTSNIKIPNIDNLLIEAAGGLMVPMNEDTMYVDFIKKTGLPVILVSRPTLGTINHTCLSIEALRRRDIELLGVIISGQKNAENAKSIEQYGNVKILAELDKMPTIDRENISNSPFPDELKNMLCN